MWSALVLVCHLSQAENFELNKIPQILPGSCFTSVAPVLMNTNKQCLKHIAMALNKPDFVMEGYQIFSYSCIEWPNHHYKGEST